MITSTPPNYIHPVKEWKKHAARYTEARLRINDKHSAPSERTRVMGGAHGQRADESTIRLKKIAHLPKGYVNPIKGWKTHAERYQEKRCPTATDTAVTEIQQSAKDGRARIENTIPHRRSQEPENRRKIVVESEYLFYPDARNQPQRVSSQSSTAGTTTATTSTHSVTRKGNEDTLESSTSVQAGIGGRDSSSEIGRRPQPGISPRRFGRPSVETWQYLYERGKAQQLRRNADQEDTCDPQPELCRKSLELIQGKPRIPLWTPPKPRVLPPTRVVDTTNSQGKQAHIPTKSSTTAPPPHKKEPKELKEKSDETSHSETDVKKKKEEEELFVGEGGGRKGLTTRLRETAQEAVREACTQERDCEKEKMEDPTTRKTSGLHPVQLDSFLSRMERYSHLCTQKRLMQAQLSEEKEVESCTFRPNTSCSTSVAAESSRRCGSLYDRGISSIFAKRRAEFAWKRQQEELEIQSCSFTPCKEPVIEVIDPKPRLEQCETNCVGQPKGRTDESMNDEELESKVLVILDDWRKQSPYLS